MANIPSSHYPDIGVLGEDFVAQWLQSTGWIILHRRWRCRRGEIDIIAQRESQLGVGEAGEAHKEPKIQNLKLGIDLPCTSDSVPLLAFVEVKTRSRGNWDADGLLSITPQKQAKLWQAAQWFLATYPHFSNYPCRFDVAIVRCQKLKLSPSQQQQLNKNRANLEANNLSFLSVEIGKPQIVAGYQLLLQEYLPAAFD